MVKKFQLTFDKLKIKFSDEQYIRFEKRKKFPQTSTVQNFQLQIFDFRFFFLRILPIVST